MSGKYLVARDAFARGELAWREGEILAQLVSREYRFDETDTEVDDLGAGPVDAPIELSGMAVNDGWLTANKMVFRQVRGDPVVAIAFHTRMGMLVEYHDAVDSFPMVPNGGDIEIEISKPGIFRI